MASKRGSGEVDSTDNIDYSDNEVYETEKPGILDPKAAIFAYLDEAENPVSADRIAEFLEESGLDLQIDHEDHTAKDEVNQFLEMFRYQGWLEEENDGSYSCNRSPHIYEDDDELSWYREAARDVLK